MFLKTEDERWETQVSLIPRPVSQCIHSPSATFNHSRGTTAEIAARSFYLSVVKIAKTEVDHTALWSAGFHCYEI